jgi:thiamine pyrophosphokinase
MGKNCLIISGGEYYIPQDWMKGSYDLIIACDRGYEYAKKAGIKPDVILGDYDSAGSRPEEGAAPVILTYISDKDDTDTMLAVKYALDKDITDIDICCALGGRFDHTYGNIMSGSLAAEHGCVSRIYGGDTHIWIFKDSHIQIPRMEGWSLSCFSISDRTCGISIKGTKFEVDDVELNNATTLGNSNNWSKDVADISCKAGTMMVVCSKLSRGEHI